MPEVDHALEAVRRTDEDLQDAVRQKETMQDRRDKTVRRAHNAGATLQQIADVLGVHRTYVHQIVRGRARITS